MPLILLIIPVLSTLTGGLIVIRFHRSILLLIALAAGLLLGAAFLDLLPEALALNSTLAGRSTDVLGIALLSFLLFFGLQHTLHAAASRWQSSSRAFGKVGGALLIFHSLRDGMAIGLSYAASHPAGLAVAMGIAAHDLGDGMNTVVLTTGGRKARTTDYVFLLADALAPLAGGLLTIWWTFSLRSSVVLLAVASGFFIQMATSDFLPELRQPPGPDGFSQELSRHLLLPAVLAGAAIIYAANFLTNHLR